METNIEPNSAATDVLKFQIDRALKNQAKSFLVILEDLLEEGNRFNYNKKRKLVLDNLNNNIRELEELINKLDIRLRVYEQNKDRVNN